MTIQQLTSTAMDLTGLFLACAAASVAFLMASAPFVLLAAAIVDAVRASR